MTSTAAWFHFQVGVVTGFLAVFLYYCSPVKHSLKKSYIDRSSHSCSSSSFNDISCRGRKEMHAETDESVPPKRYYTDANLIFVGVMTTKEFLQSRVVAANNTWVKSIPGKVVFFASEGSEKVNLPGIEVVGLRGVDDVYPPQKKAFLMLKYMYDHYIDKFRFFMRADDDVFIKVNELMTFLHSVNSPGLPVIGKVGFGDNNDVGKLHLRSRENYCMGGPGMIMTKGILEKTAPNIRYCLTNLYSDHEDVEIGRCITKFANVSCTWSYENLFYPNYREAKASFSHSLNDPEIHKAFTLHPVKEATYVYRMHQYFLSMKATRLRNRLRRLSKEIEATNTLLEQSASYNATKEQSNGMKKNLATTDDIIEWDFVSGELYSIRYNNPKQRLHPDKKSGAVDAHNQTLAILNQNDAIRQQAVKNKHLSYYFTRSHPIQGQEYMFDAKILEEGYEKKKKNNHNLAKTCRIYAHRPFLEAEFREQTGSMYVENIRTAKASLPDGYKRTHSERVNLIISLSGRYQQFLKLMKNFENVCLKTKENVSLTVMLFHNSPVDTSNDVISYVSRLQKAYSDVSLSVVLMDGSFSKGVALQDATKRFQDDDLLFFVDVDMVFDRQVLQRIRLNTVKCQTVYAPIIFSDYDPGFRSRKYSSNSAARFDTDFGYFRHYGFGMLSTYKSDFAKTAGFDQDIKGWGWEDVDLLEKFISSNITVFRSVDVGMFHLFHEISCDRNLIRTQYDMCVGTKATTIASLKTMSDIIYQTPEIFNRTSHKRPPG